MEEVKQNRQKMQAKNDAAGIKCDVEFQMMVEKAKACVVPMKEHRCTTETDKINICVWKRPVFQKEKESGQVDVVSCTNPAILVHACSYKVDGVSKFIDNSGYIVDHSFGESETTESLYENSIQP